MAKNLQTSKERRQLTKLPDKKAYAVGYAKPPEDTRFKPGISGNPKGRPKGRRKVDTAPQFERMKSIILEEAYRSIKVNDGNKQVSVPMTQAIMRSLAVAAAKGNSRSQKLFADLLSGAEQSNKEAQDNWLETAIEYKTSWEIELERRKVLGSVAPDPIPHPDDVIINLRTGEISIRGPMTKEDLADLDVWIRRRYDQEAELKVLQRDLSDPESAPYRDVLENDIAHTKRILDIIETALSLRASPSCVARRLSQLDLKPPAWLKEALGEDAA